MRSRLFIFFIGTLLPSLAWSQCDSVELNRQSLRITEQLTWQSSDIQFCSESGEAHAYVQLPLSSKVSFEIDGWQATLKPAAAPLWSFNTGSLAFTNDGQTIKLVKNWQEQPRPFALGVALDHVPTLRLNAHKIVVEDETSDAYAELPSVYAIGLTTRYQLTPELSLIIEGSDLKQSVGFSWHDHEIQLIQFQLDTQGAIFLDSTSGVINYQLSQHQLLWYWTENRWYLAAGAAWVELAADAKLNLTEQASRVLVNLDAELTRTFFKLYWQPSLWRLGIEIYDVNAELITLARVKTGLLTTYHYDAELQAAHFTWGKLIIARKLKVGSAHLAINLAQLIPIHLEGEWNEQYVDVNADSIQLYDSDARLNGYKFGDGLSVGLKVGF